MVETMAKNIPLPATNSINKDKLTIQSTNSSYEQKDSDNSYKEEDDEEFQFGK